MATDWKHITDRVDPREPYVWRLRLTEDDFARIEGAVVDGRGDARLSLIYLGEWYKRRYVAGAACPLPGGATRVGQLWDESGWLSDPLIARAADGRRLWLYSAYVLGGLPLHHLTVSPNDALLRRLCRLYYGEDTELTAVAEAEGAIAFRRSISEQQSLYHYIEAALGSDPPFAATDMQPGGLAHGFMERMRCAGDATLREKFHTEWVVDCPPSGQYVFRRLRLWLRPEDVGNGHHAYLRPERLAAWGIADAKSLPWLRVDVRLRCGRETVREAHATRPLITFVNTGSPQAGFVAWGVSRYATLAKVPPVAIDMVETVLFTPDGREIIVGRESMAGYVQLYFSPDDGQWHSRADSRKRTAAMWVAPWHTVSDDAPRQFKSLRRGEETGITACWAEIDTRLTLEDERGHSVTLYNRNGRDQVTALRYDHTLRYGEGGTVRHIYRTDEDCGEDSGEDWLPLIFSRDDILVRHYDGEGNVSTKTIDTLEYKAANGRYTPWTADDAPAYGVVSLRVGFEGRAILWQALYMPGPVRRDVERHTITYTEMDGSQKSITVADSDGDAPMPPVIPIAIGTEQDKVVVDVWRPTKAKEVVLDGRVIRRTSEPEVAVAYCRRYRLTVCEFSTTGYQRYDCRRLPSVFSQINQKIPGTALDAWQQGRVWVARELDPAAPECLRVSLGGSASGQDWWTWDYHADTDPQAANEDDQPQANTVMFCDVRHTADELICPPVRRGRYMPFSYKRRLIDMVRVFNMARRYGLYFFAFLPLEQVRHWGKELYTPLLESLGGELDNETRQDLLRLAREMGFAWEDYKIDLKPTEE